MFFPVLACNLLLTWRILSRVAGARLNFNRTAFAAVPRYEGAGKRENRRWLVCGGGERWFEQ